MENCQIEAYLKYNYFNNEQHNGGASKAKFHPANLHYIESLDCYYCPKGQPMTYIYIRTKLSKTKVRRKFTLSRYKTQNCINGKSWEVPQKKNQPYNRDNPQGQGT